MEGNIFANIPITRGAGNSAKATTTITIYHVDANSTATQLATATGDSITSNADSTTNDFMQCFILPISQKMFKIGESIKINVTIAVGNNNYIVGHDPVARVQAFSLPGKMTFHIPFKIFN
jgi:hypothetical protein